MNHFTTKNWLCIIMFYISKYIIVISSTTYLSTYIIKQLYIFYFKILVTTLRSLRYMASRKTEFWIFWHFLANFFAHFYSLTICNKSLQYVIFFDWSSGLRGDRSGHTSKHLQSMTQLLIKILVRVYTSSFEPDWKEIGVKN